MARNITSLFRFNLASLKSSIGRVPLVNGKRFLYTEEALGITNYIRVRNNYRYQFVNVENTFHNKMKEVCEDENSMVFTEDLKAMLHILEKKPEELELALKMMKKFNGQNKELRFGKYVFGPVVMRMLYFLNEPKLALEVFNDPELEGFFDQFISCQILFCLLFKNGQFNDIIDVYKTFEQKMIHGVSHPSKLLLLFMAACFKQNTPESLERALEIYRDATSKETIVMRRIFTILSALAINQNSPHIALEILSTMVRNEANIEVKCLKILACIELGKLVEIIPIIRHSLENNQIDGRKVLFFEDVVERLEQELNKQGKDESDELYKLVRQLKMNENIRRNSLHQYLMRPIDDMRKNMSSDLFRNDNLRQKRVRRNNSESNLRDLL